MGRCKVTGQFYFVNLDKFRDWGEEKTLVDIYRASEALDYMKALLLRTRDAVAPAIDSELSPSRL
jgi:hypothetical protein